jgi:N-acetylneuraminate synthase
VFKSDNIFHINGTDVGCQQQTYFIADIGANHDGDLSRAKDLIYQAKEAGADAAKFQHFSANTIVSDFGFKSLKDENSHQSEWRKSVYEVYKDASINKEWTEELKKTCDVVGITFFSSPYSFELVDHIDPFVPAYKIGSGDITWIEMIEYIASKGKPYILATGASEINDVVRAVDAALAINPQLALMQCNTNYTANMNNFRNIHLNVLKTYKLMYPQIILGLSDHTIGHTTVLGAVALGASIIEKHFTDDNSREGPDHHFAMDPNSWKEMVERTRELECSLGGGIKRIEENEKNTVTVQRRSIRITHDLQSGATLQKTDLEMLRPCPVDAIPPYKLHYLIGKKIRRSLNAGEYLKWSDIS